MSHSLMYATVLSVVTLANHNLSSVEQIGLLIPTVVVKSLGTSTGLEELVLKSYTAISPGLPP